jgi:hypothetical protein
VRERAFGSILDRAKKSCPVGGVSFLGIFIYQQVLMVYMLTHLDGLVLLNRPNVNLTVRIETRRIALAEAHIPRELSAVAVVRER